MPASPAIAGTERRRRIPGGALCAERGPEDSPTEAPGCRENLKRQPHTLYVARAARRARNLALAYWIDSLIRSGQVKSLAAVARNCGVSRSRVSQVMVLLSVPLNDQERLLS